MGKILNAQGQQATPEKVDPEQMFEALASKRTRKERVDLKNFINVQENPTEEQKAYAENMLKSLDRMFLRAWSIGVEDYRAKQRAAMQDQIRGQAAMRALKKGPGGGLKG